MWGFVIIASLFQAISGSEPVKVSEGTVTERTVDPECFLTIKEIIHHHGYPGEEYEVESDNGYILTIFRIPHGKENGSNKGPRPVIFLQHAVLGSAVHWISNLPNNSFGFILADAGYDVWLGNTRGNYWSSKHTTLKTSEKKFWEFSFHEYGYYDIPAVLYFILNKTNQEQLYFVAHSEGAAAGFVAFSSWPKLAERIKVFFALGPATALNYLRSPLRILFFKTVSNIMKYHVKQAFSFPFLANINAKICTNFPQFCGSFMSFIAGCNISNLNMSRMDVYAAHSPAGTSMQNILHWGQIYHSKRFQAYDHGSMEQNMEKYNQTTPPVYRIEDIKIPISVWSAGQDIFTDIREITALCSQISNLIHHKHIPEWVHLDFIWGLDAPERMYMDILETMKKYP